MMEIIKIAIDGPAGAGKSTIAKQVAQKLGVEYIDTGAMYRAVALKTIQTDIDYNNEEKLEQMLENTNIDFENNNIILDGRIVNNEIRTPEINQLVSKVSEIKRVREKLVEAQRMIAMNKSVVMDGRDIGTNVFPDAQYKFFINASTEERALRRWKELKAKGFDVNLEKVKKEIIERDQNDMNRIYNPLKKAEDAIEIDTSDMDIDHVLGEIFSYLHKW